MAIARITLTCSKCGKEFEVTAKKRNRRECDSFEAWAANNIDICPDCRKKEYSEKMEEERKKMGLVCRMRLVALNKQYPIAFVFDGDTKPYKEAIKDLGAMWTDYYPVPPMLTDMFRTGNRRKTWVIWTDEKEAPLLGEKIEKNLGIKVEIDIDPMEAVLYRERKAKQEEIDKKIAELGEKPKYPEEFITLRGNKRWNGKIYGKKGNWAVYLDGERINMSDDLVDKIESAQKDIEEYNMKVSDIVSRSGT